MDLKRVLIGIAVILGTLYRGMDLCSIIIGSGNPNFPRGTGIRCRVLARGMMNSILVEFEDGFKVVTSRYAARKIQ